MLTRHPASIRSTSPEKQEPIDQAYSCWCCKDSGLVLIGNVRKYLIPDYQDLDVPVICKNCRAAGNRFDSVVSRLDGRASAEDCHRIHQAEWRSAKEATQGGAQKVLASVASLAGQMQMPVDPPGLQEGDHYAA